MNVLLGALLLAAFTATAGAQEFPSDPLDFLSAKLAAEDGRYDEALSLLDKVIAKNPDNPVLLYEHAMVLIDASRVDRAEGELRRVTELNPDFYDAQRVLGRLLLDRSNGDRARVDEALKHLQAAFKLNGDDLSTGVTISQLLVSTGRAAEAERVLAQLLERAPDQRAINYNYAQVLTKLGRGNESRKYLERALELDPTFGPAVLQLIDIYQKENEWQKAADLLQPLISDDPMNLDLQKQQAFFYLRAGMPEKARTTFKNLVAADPKDTRSQFYLAEALSDLEQYEEAEKIYRGLLEKSPNDPEFLISFALSQVAQKKYPEAVKSFNALLAQSDVPDNLQALAKTQLAFIALQKGDYEQAVAGVRPILIFRDQPNSQAIGIALDALRKEKKYTEAIVLLQPLVNKFASDPYLNARYIEMLLHAGDKARATEAAATQAKFGPKNTIAAAEAYVSMQDYAPAIALLRQQSDAKPDDNDLAFELGSVYERSGDRANAEKVFASILQKQPDNAAALNYLGYMWAESGVNLDRAAEMLTKAVSQDPRNGAYIDSLGWVYFRQGKLDLAEKYLLDATHLLPHDATVQEHLGDVFAKRGDLMRALTTYRHALTLEPEQKDEATIRLKIAELERQTQVSKR
ncbi:MAG TPA: tetratricopeptide repeat protein [Thermoanaerobaculia bacterium]|nr:tetratricopeptide repeat protein [Thermoanaerobaculia bacterium]